jgi:hypothetical protein
MQTIEIIEKLSPNLKYITFNQTAAKDFANSVTEKDIEEGKISLATYDWSLEDQILILFYFNAMNYCYWAQDNEKKWTIEIEGKELDGSFALYRILEENAGRDRNFLRPSYIASLSLGNFRNLLDGNPQIPLLESRYENLINTAKVLSQKYGGDAMSMIEENHYDTEKILDEIETSFSS